MTRAIDRRARLAHERGVGGAAETAEWIGDTFSAARVGADFDALLRRAIAAFDAAKAAARKGAKGKPPRGGGGARSRGGEEGAARGGLAPSPNHVYVTASAATPRFVDWDAPWTLCANRSLVFDADALEMLIAKVGASGGACA